MQPFPKTAYELFSLPRRYTVPLYQRSYVWNREEQWMPLWEDIENRALDCLERLEKQQPIEKTHFLGAIVLSNPMVVGRGLHRSEVIDGQQRLTTLQIFLAALRDYAALIDENLHSDLVRLTENPVHDKESEELFKVWPTNTDRETYRKIMTAGSLERVVKALEDEDDILSGLILPRMGESYRYFYSVIKEFIDNEKLGQKPQDRLYAIIHALKTALQFVVIELEKNDDPQVIFETLNARGQPLLPSDLIRNFIFLEAANKGADTDRLYNKYWREFDDKRINDIPDTGENRFWHIDERQGRLTRPRIDLFIFHYLTMKTESDLNIGRLYREFRDWYSVQTGTVEDFLKDMDSYRDHFARLILPEGTDRLDVFARRLKALDTNTVYPFLLYIMGLPSETMTRPAFEQIITDLESWLVRRFVCGLTPKNYNRFFVALLRLAKQAVKDGKDLSSEIRTELTRSTEKTLLWPSDSEFLKGWLETPVYVKSRPDRSVMLLLALDQEMKTRKSESFGWPNCDLTVEHLLPQTYDLDIYPYPQNFPLKEGDNEEDRRKRLIHTVGNLTVLTAPLNTSISNGPFPDKVLEISKFSDLRLNSEFRTKSPSKWDEQEIESRGKQLFDFAKNIWPTPQTKAA